MFITLITKEKNGRTFNMWIFHRGGTCTYTVEREESEEIKNGQSLSP